jgi:antirestriction protein ArdC
VREETGHTTIQPATIVRCHLLKLSGRQKPMPQRLAMNVHWIKSKGRLDRDFGRKSCGDEGYAREELVAELGSAFLAADLGIAIEPREDHAAYIRSWLSVLKQDKRAIVQAASHAEKAVRYLHGLQQSPTLIKL